MRKFLIDTDTGSDDAVALMMAVLSRQAEVVAVTAVYGNVPLETAVKNAIMTLEVCGSSLPVHPGAARPMFRAPVTAVNVHGQDGMGDQDLIHPAAAPSTVGAVERILECARRWPGELEIVTLGPVTNIAAAILSDRAAMAGVRHIYTMGTAGFGPGNCTPVAEFNVYADADSYRLLLESGIPLTIIGFDVCLGDAAWNRGDMERIERSGPAGRFAVRCNRALLEYNLRRSGQYMVDLPDAVAMGVALWPEMVTDLRHCRCHCCTGDDRCYGQVILYDPQDVLAIENELPPARAQVVAGIDAALYKKRLEQLLTGGPA